MALLAAFIVTGILGLLCAWLSSIVGFDLYWLLVAACALWAAADSRAHGFKRFERVFPLEPTALFFTMLVLWPIAFPWYLNLKNKALQGLLKEPTRPSRAKYVLVGLAVLGGLSTIGFYVAFRASPTLRALATLDQAVQVGTQDPVRASLSLGGTLTLSVLNSATPASDHAGRAATARRLASLAAQNLGSLTVHEIDVQFLSDHERGGVRVTRTEDSFGWPRDSLVGP
jgi:hypothetical protein